MCFDIFYTTFEWKIYLSKYNSAYIITHLSLFSCNVSFIVVGFDEALNFSTDLKKNPQTWNFMKIPAAWIELDRQAETNSDFSQFSNAPNKSQSNTE
jgi:hypothetical protein